MAGRQYTTPLIVQHGKAVALERLRYEGRDFDEDRLQQLLYSHSALLPIRDLEPVYSDCFPVARELPTGAGPVDLVLVNERGFVTLVETKLWRNPEARRTVVAQIIDYAKEMARWSYGDFAAAIAKVRPGDGPEWLARAAAERSEDFDEAFFVDSISRNLRRGRFLLLIVGDGVREEVELMAEYLQQTPQLAFTLGLVEIALFHPPDGLEPLFVQPRIVARTTEVTRAIVEVRGIAPDQVRISLPTEQSKTAERRTVTEEEYFEALASASGQSAVEAARQILDAAATRGLDIKWGSGGPLIRFVDDVSGEYFTFGQLGRTGRLESLWSLPFRCERLGLPSSITDDYWESLVRIIAGASVREFPTKQGHPVREVVVGPKRSDTPPFAPLAARLEEWLGSVKAAAESIREHLQNR